MPITSAEDVFFDQLKDLHSAMRQTVATLPDLLGWCTDVKLREALQTYQGAASRHLTEITAIFESHSKDPGDDICKAMAGLIEGGNAHIETAGDAIVRDSLIIAHSSRIGYYLRAAACFTLGIARKCDLVSESDVLREILERQKDFTGWLAEVAAEEFDIEMGGER